jgi:hypothetical protein
MEAVMKRIGTGLMGAAIGSILAASGMVTLPARADTVGTAAAVNTEARASGKTLVLGAQVVHNERIETDAKGSVQLLFIDRTTMNIGPNSSVVIDNYVFDPNRGTGSLTLTMSKGLLRFVGGSVTHDGSATIKTPTATMGIRGGTAQFSVGPHGTQATFLGSNQPGGGIFIKDHHGGGTDLIRPGFTTTIGDGTSSPFRIDPQVLAQQNSQFGSRLGQHGGAGNGTYERVSHLSGGKSGIVASNHINSHSSSTSGNGEHHGGNDDQNGPFGNDAQQAAQNNQVLDKAFQQVAFMLAMTNCCDSGEPTSPAPYLPDAFAFTGDYVNTPVLGYKAAGQAPVTLQYGFNITGAGSGQSSWFYVATGTVGTDSSGNPVYYGDFAGSARGSATDTAGFAGGSFSSGSGGLVISSASGVPTSGSITQDRFDPQTGTGEEQDASYFNGAYGGYEPPQTYQFNQSFTSLTAPSDLGQNRPAVTLNGYATGIVETLVDGVCLTDAYIVNNATGLPTDVTIALDPTTSLVQANFNVHSLDAPSGGYGIANYQFGSLTANDGTSAYIDYNHFGATAAKNSDGSPTSTIDSQAINSHQGAMVVITSDEAAAVATAAGYSGQLCQCAFTRWGAWSTDSKQFNNYDDRSHMSWWVAGQLPNAGDVPLEGTATYNGHAIASIDNNGDQYIAAGSFTNAVDFGTHSGNVTINGLDGTDYSGSVNLNIGATTFAGSLAGNVGDRSIALDGSFFVGTAGPVGEMGGQLAITGTNYLGAGIFAASTTGVIPPP